MRGPLTRVANGGLTAVRHELEGRATPLRRPDKLGPDERVPAAVSADRDLLGHRLRPRRRLYHPADDHRAEVARRREALLVRMRLQRLRRRPDEVRRPLLPGLDPVHHLRPGGGVSVPLGGQPAADAACHRGLRLHLDDGVPWRADGRLHLRVEEGRAGMGVVVPAGSAARASVEGYDAKVHDPYFDEFSQRLADKGFITTAADDLIT